MKNLDNNRIMPFSFPPLNCRCVALFKREKDNDIIRKVSKRSFRQHEKLMTIYGEFKPYKIYLN